VTVQVVHHEAHSTDTGHLAEKLNGVGGIKVMEEKSRVRDVEGIVRIRKSERIFDVDPNLGTESRRKAGVEMGTPEAHRHGIQVDARCVHTAAKGGAALYEVHEVVPAPSAYVQQSKGGAFGEEGIEHCIRRTISSEQPIDESKIAESPPEMMFVNGEIVHPLAGKASVGKVRKRKRGHERIERRKEAIVCN